MTWTLFLTALLAWPPLPRNAASKTAVEKPVPAAPSRDSDEAFRSTISPLLLTRCSPCHAPGGKMYGKMPFDEPATIRSHAPGVLKRLKGDDKETVRAWLETR
jgi:hypothetical protein